MKIVKYFALMSFLCVSELLGFELYNSNLVVSENQTVPLMPGQSTIFQTWRYDLNFVFSEEKNFNMRNNLKTGLLLKAFPSEETYKNKFLTKFLELYLSTEISPGFFIDVGKFVEKNGTGYFKSPTDFFNMRWNLSKSHRRYSEENLNEGIVAIKNEIFLNNFWNVQLLFSPRICWDTVKYKVLSYISSPQEKPQFFASFSSLKFKSIDTKLLMLYKEQLYFGINWNLTRGNNLEIHGDFSLRESIKNTGVDLISKGDTVEFLVQRKSVKWPIQALIGCVYTFPDQSAFIVEYFYNGRGVRGSAYDNIMKYTQQQFLLFHSTDAFSVLESYGIAELARHYIFERFYREIKTEKIYMEFMNLTNLQDLSGIFFSRFGKRTNTSDLSVGLQMFYGGEDSEYGILPTNWKMTVEAEFIIF